MAAVDVALLRNASAHSIAVWRPPPEVPLPAVAAGTWQRVNEWLEEVGYLREGVKLIGGGTAFSFQQTQQSQNADGASLTNSVAETALATSVNFLGSGAGTVVGGFFQSERTIGVHFRGALSSLGAAPGNFNLNLRQDSTAGTTAGAQTAYTLANSLATSPMALDAYLVCRADGSAGNVETSVEYTPGATPSASTNIRQLARANISSFDTTGTRLFVVTGLFSTASAANIALAKIWIVEVLN